MIKQIEITIKEFDVVDRALKPSGDTIKLEKRVVTDCMPERSMLIYKKCMLEEMLTHINEQLS